ncbi:hypothetical protein ACO0M4_28825 [Streptomyces sp. RGM 3693]|uniref:hypothetical protein n=1 Tax=Streptomyces sp. RGM 3693 TaxID=3413284 RepID=UPI003D2784C7
MASDSKSTVEEVNAGQGPAVLCVDFRRFDNQPRLADLLGDGKLHTYRLDPVRLLAQGNVARSLDEIATGYAERVLDEIGEPAVVAATCNAATLGLRLAQRIGRTAARPALLLVDPSWPTPASVGQEFAALRSTIASPAVGGGPAEADVDPLDLQAMLDLLRTDLVTVLNADGVADDEAPFVMESLLPRYRAWLGLLVATCEDTAPPPSGPIHAVLGSDSCIPDWADDAWDLTRMPVSSADILTPGTPAAEHLHQLVRSLISPKPGDFSR